MNKFRLNKWHYILIVIGTIAASMAIFIPDIMKGKGFIVCAFVAIAFFLSFGITAIKQSKKDK